MEIINVIVSHPECPVNSIESFGVLDDESRDETVEEAQNCFIETAVRYQFGEEVNTTRDDLTERNHFREDCSEALDDGYIDAGGHTISIVHSYIENIQL